MAVGATTAVRFLRPAWRKRSPQQLKNHIPPFQAVHRLLINLQAILL
jgi:hypothetical protein